MAWAWPSVRRDLLILGLYLTFRGYHSFDGDQAYRLPLLLHWLDPAVYSADPFVRAFDSFNPHRGWLTFLGLITSLVGLSAALFVLFVATFMATCRGIEKLARETWPQLADSVGWIAIILVLTAKAGNIGTNHLFEATVLDRLLAMGLGWITIAEVVCEPMRGGWRAMILLGLAALIHPSLGLQLALIVAGTWGLCGLLGGRADVTRAVALRGMASAALGVIPGLVLNLKSGHLLLEGLPPGDFWTLAVELQGPQHMLPHLWRQPQWLAWGCYLVLAGLSLFQRGDRPKARVRMTLMLSLLLIWLAAAWMAIEVLQHTRMTVFQPFRMATVARGLAVILIAGRVGSLWSDGTWFSRLRAVFITVGLTGDWLMVVVTAAELITTLAEFIGRRAASMQFPARSIKGSTGTVLRTLSAIGYFGSLSCGLVFLGRHDTESGHLTILLVLAGWLALALARRHLGRGVLGRLRFLFQPRLDLALSRKRALIALAWTVPCLALLAGSLPEAHPLARTPVVRGLVARCRFTPVPIDDIERLALWCREHTPASARFIGPPGPKTFRLWSRRSLAFNRAGSPYHAAGLADWFARFQDHVDSRDTPAVFVQHYLAGRHRLESAYDRMDPGALSALALRQGADYLIAAAALAGPVPQAFPAPEQGPLRLLHVEGRFAVYRVEPSFAAAFRHPRERALPPAGWSGPG
jgi:hypothetical protein